MKVYESGYFLPFTISIMAAEILTVQKKNSTSLNSKVDVDYDVIKVWEKLLFIPQLLNSLESLEQNKSSKKASEKKNVYEATQRIFLSTKQSDTITTTVRADLASEQLNNNTKRDIEENITSITTRNSSTNSTPLNNQEIATSELPSGTLSETITHVPGGEMNASPVPHFDWLFRTGLMKSYSNNTKYILQWSEGCHKPFTVNMKTGQQIFINRNCSFTNCVITKTKNLLDHYTKFDAVVFFAKDLLEYQKYFGRPNLPLVRSPSQKYIFASYDYTRPYPRNSSILNGFFNWTWTYRLDSDLPLTHFVVKDMQGNIVAPKNDVKWIKQADMLPVSNEVRSILNQKKEKTVVAWFDSCSSLAPNMYPVIAKLSKHLKSEYAININRFGKYSARDCSTDETKDECDQMLRRDFHFYLAFEEQISEDFVSDNVVRALNNLVIPIVLGGANYTKFLPEGSYIDIFDYDICTLAEKINELLNDFDKYVEYFKWTNHYTFHSVTEDPQTDHLCRICEMLNDESQPNKIYNDFTNWWGISRPKLRPITVITIVKDAPYEKPSPVARFIDKTAQTVSAAVKKLVTDVKNFWNKLTLF